MRSLLLASSLLLVPALAAAQGPLTPGRQVTGAITSDDPTMSDESHYDEWTFAGKARHRYRIAMNSRDFDAYLLIGKGRGHDFDQSATNDDGGEGTNALLSFTAPADGEYVIHANTVRSDEVGDYTLLLTDDGEAPPLRPVALTAMQAVSGKLERLDQMTDEGKPVDYYKFTARANRRYALTMLSRDFDAIVEAGHASNGAFVKDRSDDDGGGGTNARLEWVARENGEVWIAARSLNSDSGRYTLLLEDLGDAPPPSQPMMLKPDRTISGTLDSGDESGEDGNYDVYTIDAQAGQVIVVRMESDAFDPVVAIGQGMGADWHEMDKDDDGGIGTNAHLEYRIPEAGTYVIHARAIGRTGTGAYTISLEVAEAR